MKKKQDKKASMYQSHTHTTHTSNNKNDMCMTCMKTCVNSLIVEYPRVHTNNKF